ncbi:MAG: sigma-70 family RNA polymerase sigma factor [Ruminococcaceae bacterium]|nr:sigma-70 family RNA polymerase sigma factor [Oscillospiraceae bacterium]
MTTKERDKKVEENLGLVHSLARKFMGRGAEYEDIVSAGCIGLIKAIDNFDESRGLKLSTYAVPAILGEIKRIWRDGGAVKVSRSIKELSLKAVRLNEQNLKLCGKELSIKDLSQKLGVSEEDVSEALSSAQLPISLSFAFENDEDSKELLIPTDSFDESLTDKLSLSSAICTLDEKDKQLITLRYFKNKTQSDTAKVLGMTQVQVSRREKKILTILREKLST